ncbi:MAG: hypothetical protein ABIQ17_01890 [Candidatus Limnocylindrales bacterium]
MTEILTESFCERCGTRYTFESAAGGHRRLGGLKVLGLGLKNFVMSDGSSIDEAMAAARSESERHLTNHQLDAFHRTFNFCMSCRQYTCADCWNAAEAHCLTCSPLALAEAALPPDEIDPARLLRYTGGLAPGPEVAAVSEVVAEPEVVSTDADSIEATAHTLEEPGSATTSAADGPGDVDGVTAGQSLEEALAAYEATLEVGLGAPEDTAVLAEPDAPPEAVEAPEAVELATEPEPVEDAEPEGVPLAAEPGADTISQPVWPSAPAPGSPSTPPQWPTGPRWPTGMPATRDTTAGETTTPPPTAEPEVDHLAALISRGSSDAMWAASSREILRPTPTAPPPAAIQACSNCGISLSATARFCRRCGTSQG